jgi:hypothetical protein
VPRRNVLRDITGRLWDVTGSEKRPCDLQDFLPKIAVRDVRDVSSPFSFVKR